MRSESRSAAPRPSARSNSSPTSSDRFLFLSFFLLFSSTFSPSLLELCFGHFFPDSCGASISPHLLLEESRGWVQQHPSALQPAPRDFLSFLPFDFFFSTFFLSFCFFLISTSASRAVARQARAEAEEEQRRRALLEEHSSHGLEVQRFVASFFSPIFW